ncbi:MAG: S8 family peptidase [Planctomycetota bacterium]
MAVPVGVAAIPLVRQNPAPAPIVSELDRNPHVELELLVQFKVGTTAEMKANILGMIDATIIETVVSENRRSDLKGDLELIKIQRGLKLEAAILQLERNANVEFAEPNWIYQHTATSNDTYYSNGALWGMYGDGLSPANQYGCQANEAWAAGHTGASNVYVGVIDEGIMYTHKDLGGQIWRNALEVQNGIDDDGNGYKDDVRGWDFNGNNNTIYDGTFDDHGTHCAGTIGAQGGNAMGVAGVCWNVTMIPAKFLGTSGGTLSNAVKACDYITNIKIDQGLNIVATNNSWGGGGYSQSLFDAIERANNEDILFVAAAGNNGANIDTGSFYPAGYSNANVISVAAITSSGGLASFSNYGATKVDLGAPGNSIISTVPYTGTTPSYSYYSGTSMAAPHVTGAAALYASTHPAANAATIKSAILGSVTATSSLAGKCVTGGRLNVSGF